MPDEAQAQVLRESLRRLGRLQGTRVRTARVEQTVVVARVDAPVWSDDQATMRAKLTPPD